MYTQNEMLELYKKYDIPFNEDFMETMNDEELAAFEEDYQESLQEERLTSYTVYAEFEVNRK